MKTQDIVIVSSVASVGLGVAVGYFVANKRAQTKWQAIAQEEIDSVKKQYKLLAAEDEYEDPEVATEAFRSTTDKYLERLDELGYQARVVDIEERSQVADVVFEKKTVAESPSKFDEDYPFPIMQAEYFHDEQDYDKLSITYYAGDDTVADTRDDIINDVASIIGSCHKKFMGYDPKEPYVVYVRNHKNQQDFEVVFDERAFISAVHGIEVETDE